MKRGYSGLICSALSVLTLAQCGLEENGRNFRLDLRKNVGDGLGFGLPGEMDRQRPSLVSHAHPEIVRCDRTKFRDQKMRRDGITQRFHGEHSLLGRLEGDEVFGLDLAACGGCELHFEMRKALVPLAGEV